MIIVGAGGYACEVAALLRDLGRSFVGAVDDGSPDLERLADAGVDLVGTLDDAATLATEFVVGIGYAQPRLRVALALEERGMTPCAPILHRTAVLLSAVTVGAGSVVMPNTTMSRGSSCGPHGLINYNASVGHDTALGSGVTIGPNAAIGGECRIGDGVLVGSGAVVLQGLDIGAGATIGSGAVVTRSVTDGATIVGVPGRARP